MLTNFQNLFKDELNLFIQYKKSLGYDYKQQVLRLKKIDNILFELKLKSKIITKATFEKLIERKNTQKGNYNYQVVNDFCKFLISNEFKNIYYIDKKWHANKNYIPTILNDDELKKDKRNASLETMNQRLATIKSFYKFVQIKEPNLFNTCSEILSIKNKKVPKKIISYFSEEEITIMVNYLNKKKNLKYLMLICVLYETGARVTELINIKISDINLSENASIILHGKGNKTRIVPISKELTKLINKYLTESYIDYGQGLLLYSKNKERYARCSINYLVNNLVKQLKNENPLLFKGKYHPHSFRHSKASHLYNNGTPLLYIKDFLGHSSILATEIYATSDSKKQRELLLNNAQTINVKERYTKSKKENLENWLKPNMK